MTTAPPQDRAAPPQDRGVLPPPSGAPRYDPRHRPVRLAAAAGVGLLAVVLAAAGLPDVVRDAEVQSFELPEGTRELRIVSATGDVDVRGVGAGEAASLSADKHWSFREPEASLERAGAVTTVSVDCPSFSMLGRCYADWTVAVPEDLKVVVRSTVGDVELAGLTGDLQVASTVGQVTVDASPASLDVATSVGDVSVVLGRPADVVAVRTSVGDVDLTLPGGVSYDVRASSIDPADVLVDTSPASEHRVTVESSVGSILVADG